MDIENYRWIMSTVPQVLGAITALIITGFFIWIEQLKSKVKQAEDSFYEYVRQNSDVVEQIIARNSDIGVDYDNLYEKIDEIRTSQLLFEDTFKIGSKDDNVTFFLQWFRTTAETNKNKIRKAKIIKTPVLINGITIIVSLLFLVLAQLIQKFSFILAPLYITSGIILLSAVLCLYLYYKWLSKMIFSASSDL